MPASENPAALSQWNVPECPFIIEYSPRTLDEIRLAVTEALFSLQRGGVEIGGILFGKWDGKRLAITDYAALDCEHAFGPSFTLSPKDETRLAALLVAPAGKGLRPAGWYHSHTRSEIFLSDADQKLHRRFFPEPWQVALVLKPHTFHPTKAGFFFRGADGGIHAETSYNEFVVEPLSVKQAAPAGAPAGTEPEPAPVRRSDPQEAPPVAAERQPLTEGLPLPGFAVSAPPRSRLWLKITAALLAGFTLGAVVYLTRDSWLPPLLAVSQQHASAQASPALGLNMLDYDGQLQIRWNRDAAGVQHASSGVLSISSGGNAPQEIQLDKAQLLSGVVTIERQTERVDASLRLTQADGSQAHEMTTFMGKLPERKPVAPDQQRDNLAKQVSKIQTDLNAQIARSTKLEKAVDELGKQVRETKSRLVNRVPGKN